MSIKHGLLMSLALGATAALGAFGSASPLHGVLPTAEAATLPPAATPQPSTAPASTAARVQLASATPGPADAGHKEMVVPASATTPEIILDFAEQDIQGLTIKPVQLAQAAPAPAAVVGKPAAASPKAPGTLAKAAGLNALACSDIYLNFDGAPRRGAAPLQVSFTCTSSLSDGNGGPTAVEAPVVGIQWYFDDPTSAATVPVVQVIDPDRPLSSQAQTHIFDATGVYPIGMRLILEDPTAPGTNITCPPATERPFIKTAFVIVGESSTNSASFDATDLLCASDAGGILPLQDWVPLASITLAFNPTTPAPRVLAHLKFTLLDQDLDPIDERDILQFALFVDTSVSGPADQVLDTTYDGHISYTPVVGVGQNFFAARTVAGSPLLTWESSGLPYETPVGRDGTGTLLYSLNDANYNLNFIFNPTDPGFQINDPLNPANPQWPFIKEQLDPVNIGPQLNWPIAWESENTQWAYILAMRAGSTWPSERSVRIIINNAVASGYIVGAEMLPFDDDRNQEFANYLAVPLPMGTYPIDPDTGLPDTTDVVSPFEPLSNPPLLVDRFPFTENGPLDTYNPNFFDGDGLVEECARTASFDVFDFTGGLLYDNRAYPAPIGVVNNYRTDWNWPNKLYTPVAEHFRPRWDLGEVTFDFVTGEWMDIRRIFSLEEWMPVIGINAHSACERGQVYLRNINVICTDIGADPYGPPGNGGFNPSTGLDHMTTEVHGNYTSDNLGDLFATGLDYTFNGIGVFYDTGSGDACSQPNANCGGNGVFDPPTPLDPTGAGAGVAFTDLPLVPEPLTLEDMQNEGLFQWEYVPFPPGGGDPWWRMRMRFATERKVANNGDYGARGELQACGGWLEGTPETQPGIRENADMFVVIRADSGFRDVSGLVGDGTGMPFGADTRVFVEPRNWNPLDGGHWDGGLLFSNTPIDTTIKYWQDDPFANSAEVDCDFNDCDLIGFPTAVPWFNERTMNPDTVKPIRCGVDVHDYVLTYSSNNRYAKQSYINVGQRIFVTNPIDGEIVEVPQLTVGSARTAFSFWMDPPILRDTDDLLSIFSGSGAFNSAFLHDDTPGVIADNSDRIAPAQDEFTEIQYAFETVPFALKAGAGFTDVDIPVSPFYPNPAPQPNLPDILNWPQLARAVASGADGYCYLASEGAVTNEPFINPTSSNSEKSYEDDVYIFVGNDGVPSTVEPGMWLVDRYGGKFRIAAVSGNEMTLEHGHHAYLDQFYRFRTDGTGNPAELSVPQWPYGVEVGQAAASRRGRWVVVRDTLVRNEYPRQSNWPAGLSADPEFGDPARGARILKQHVMQESTPTALLGFNVASTQDPVVNAAGEATLRSLTVAFWGPEFEPSQLAKLDQDGVLISSGVLLYEDTNGSGTFEGPIFSDLSPTPSLTDRIVPLQGGSLSWPANSEPVDLDGDYQPDDLSGDGLAIFGDADLNALTPAQLATWDGYFDNAWVLRIQPAGWVVPHTDFREGLLFTPSKSLGLADELTEVPTVFKSPSFWGKTPATFEIGNIGEKAGEKTLNKFGNFGDDLWMVIRTSDEVKAFENFRCVVPARLPLRTPLAEQIAGVQYSPRTYLATSSFDKLSPDEGPVQDFYGHDMIEVSVPVRVTDLSGELTPNPIAPGRLVTPGGPPAAVLGIDASANRPENLVAEGSGGTVQSNVFTTGSFNAQPAETYYDDNGWTQEVVGLWVITLGAAAEPIDSRVEAYQITAAAGNDLTLQAGTPAADTAWQIVKDPTFLEQVIVELYDRNNDGGFDITQDLLPLNQEDPANGKFSGVSLWRDNDLSPLNTNGEFDPPVTDATGNVIQYIDLPVRLDDEPELIGVQGEPQYQVRMVFSSPGTDNSDGRNTVPYTSQPLLRQPIPQEFGRASSDTAFGPDFFVVLRTSRNMDGGDDVQAAIVSWGPDTPTEPDPDNFSVSLGSGVPAGQGEDQFDLFSEFPAGARGLGFITFFQNPQPVRYWSLDQDRRKTRPVTEVDHSQDNAPVKYWQRSTANLATRTTTLTALPSPEVDFTADRHRQVVGGPVKFTLIATGSIRLVTWDFGDGTTSTETNPTHIYAAPGVYGVQVTVRDEFGIEDTARKDDYIEIVPAPFADFVGTPTDATLLYEETKSPQIGRDVTFTDLSIGGDDYTPISWFWNFGDGSTLRVATGDPVVHRYTKEGFYTVTLEVTFRNNATNETTTSIQRLVNYITIRACVGCPNTGEGEGEGEGQTEVPAADFTITSEVRDQEAVPPLSDWVPLLNFTMSYAEDTPAPRVLQFLDLLIRGDSRGSDDLPYANLIGPDVTDLLEFGLFIEQKSSDDANNQELDRLNDFLLYKWDATGSPVGTIVASGFGNIQYRLDFIGDGTALDPQFPVVAASDSDANIKGNSYVIAVRTSPTWRSQISMRCDVLGARMIIPSSGSFPVDEENAPIDSYSPNFYDGELLEEEVGYSSSFDVWSLVGTPSGVPGQEAGALDALGVAEYDAWSNGRVYYTPLAEHSRPRWNSPGHLLSAVGGEFLEIRSLAGLEQWVPVIGINAHSTKTVHVDDDVSGVRFISGKDAAQLREVNVILTDVGADPFGPPGNGGFNPVDMLNKVTGSLTGSGTITSDFAIGSDVSFNGIWIWNDTNNNGLFDPPTANDIVATNGGITMQGDRPMFPEYISSWEYIPLPPGGGDPWWKIKMGVFGGTRRNSGDEDDVEGYLEKVPDAINPFSNDFTGSSEYTNDYFVVVRPDSGVQDASTLSGDGSGMTPGADFKAFIEPRRFNAVTGHTDGGIYLDSMLPPQGLYDDFGNVADPWQDDPLWGSEEPWWPQRTVNANSTQKVRTGVEVHDLIMTYESDSDYNVYSDLFFGEGSYTEDRSCLGYAFPGDSLTDFDRWLDPFGLLASHFYNQHTVGVSRFGITLSTSFTLSFPEIEVSDTIAFSLQDSGVQYAFETAPFNNGFDGAFSQRSPAYPVTPEQPTLPEYATWSFTLRPGEYPRLSQWADDQNRARLLTQKTDIDSDVTAMLGIDAIGTIDPFVNQGVPVAIRDITVAFWGPDFTPDKLQPLDPNGENTSSGILLWEDADKSSFLGTGDGTFNLGLSTGTFFPPTTLQDYAQTQLIAQGLGDVFDRPVALRNLAWPTQPELIDLDGDGAPDDMNGDGFVDQADKAWVVKLSPRVAWQAPQNDLYNDLLLEVFLSCGSLVSEKSGKGLHPEYVTANQAAGGDKQIEVTGAGLGDDLFVAVRTSGKLSRFEKFRAVVPATLPERAQGQRAGGVQFSTGPETSVQAAVKSNPDEDPEQDFYGHDMLEANVPTRILDQTTQSQTVVIGGAATPTLALDLATNLDLTVDSGDSGQGDSGSFTVSGKAWAANAFANAHWLIDGAYEAYQIAGNSANRLTLLSGTPRPGKWRIVKDPTFIEQLVVEFYNEGTDAEFNPASDLLPLDIDQELSGVAIYRDNDNDPNNRNGVFDPNVDIPVTLDTPPAFVGAAGDLKAKFVFASPGTDDYAGAVRDNSGNVVAGSGVSLAQQARHRQWVQDSFGNLPGDPDSGADFFVVVRASSGMTPNDNFRVGIVNWGPNTPTEPDPDTWAGLSGSERNDYVKFEEFPWGQRGIGYISFFGTPPARYFMDGATAMVKADNSGYNWIRSHSTKKRRSGAIKAITRPVGPTSLVISSASETQLPPQILPGEDFQVLINGKGFGTSPVVRLSGYTVNVVEANDTAVKISLTTPAGVIPKEPLVLIVRNSTTNDTQSRSDLFTLEQVSTQGPRVSAVVPARGSSAAFPVTIQGLRFPGIDKIRVLFGSTIMPVKAVSGDGTSILVEFPAGGLPGEGLRNVTVQEVKANGSTGSQDTLVNGFDYVNTVVTPGKTFILCAPGGPGSDNSGGDWALVAGTLGLLAAASLRRRVSRSQE